MVSTDGEEYPNMAGRYSADTSFPRPVDLAGDASDDLVTKHGAGRALNRNYDARTGDGTTIK